MKSITVHNMDDQLSTALDRLAKNTGKSKNKVIKEILRKALGITKNNGPNIDLSLVVNTLSEKEGDDLLNNIKAFDEVDLNDW